MPVLSFNLTTDFKASLAGVRAPRGFGFPLSDAMKTKLKTFAVSSAAGWCGVILVGAVLMARAAHVATPKSAPAEIAAASAPAPKAAAPAAPPKADAIAAAVANSAAPPAAQQKSTQRVDTTPTASIPADPPAKLKHKPHKKKPKPLDNNT